MSRTTWQFLAPIAPSFGVPVWKRIIQKLYCLASKRQDLRLG
jgi:hypothetical protein